MLVELDEISRVLYALRQKVEQAVEAMTKPIRSTRLGARRALERLDNDSSEAAQVLERIAASKG